MTELEIKLERLSGLIQEYELDGLLLNRVSSFAWATCGAASYVNTAATNGAASLLITPKNRIILADNIEATRIEKEEKLAEQGWKLHIRPWYLAAPDLVSLAGGDRLAADGPISGGLDLSRQIARLRAQLTPEEGKRFRLLGSKCAEIMDTSIRSVKPGMDEHQIAALLAGAAQSRGIQAIVNLVATDERIFAYRHPLPTGKKLKKYAMLVLCGRERGLVCSITRLIHFGRIPTELLEKSQAVARVDAAMIINTSPGNSLGEVLGNAQYEYTKVGFPDEWKLHHQGGATGYETREYLGYPNSDDLIHVGQVFAWNPSITGTKSEDTILVGSDSNEVLTQIQGWPTLMIEYNQKRIDRPAILEII